MEREVVAERSQAVLDVAAAVDQLVPPRRVDRGHVTSGHAHAAAILARVTCAVVLDQAGDVFHHEAVQLAPATTAACAAAFSWKTLHTSQPLYPSELISHYLPHRSLRSSNTNLLTRPAGITSNFSSQAFSVSAPSSWNSLPAHIRSIDTLSTCKRHLKFHLFQSAFTV